MHTLETTRRAPTRHSWRRAAARWVVTFVGFPAGGLTAMLLVGPVDTVTTALAGGLITGTILGAAQAWGLRRSGPGAIRWVAATGVGLSIGLGIGATSVGFRTSLAALVVQGAVCGLAVGAAQALALSRHLGRRLGRIAVAWPAALAVIWALGWAITYAAGIAVTEQFTIFGSSGAVAVTALTAILPVLLSTKEGGQS
jgi:hypothetical protein